MKQFFAVFLIFLIPLTLASDTQYRFKVYVEVNGDDEQAVNTIESHLKREFRLLGDVDVVGKDGDWKYILSVSPRNMEFIDKTKTEHFIIAYYAATKFPKDFIDTTDDRWAIAFYSLSKPVMDVVLGSANYSRERLPEWCINLVNKFDKGKLEPIRQDTFK